MDVFFFLSISFLLVGITFSASLFLHFMDGGFSFSLISYFSLSLILPTLPLSGFHHVILLLWELEIPIYLFPFTLTLPIPYLTYLPTTLLPQLHLPFYHFDCF